MSSSEVNLEKLRMSRKEIDRVQDCDFKTGAVIKPDVYGYKGRLPKPYREVMMFPEFDIKSRWYGECEGTSKSGFIYSDELKILSRFHHENILPFIGYCDKKDVFFQEGVDRHNKVILVYGGYYGNLARYIQGYEKGYFPWAQRLRICIGIAYGLNYLHSGVKGVGRVIHHDQIMQSATSF